MADDLGTAVLRITVDDSAARESLRLLRQDIQRSSRATGGRTGVGQRPSGPRENVNALEVARERRFRLARRIDELERRGADVARLRTQLGRLTTFYTERQFGSAQRLSRELARQVTLSERRELAARRAARAESLEASRGARQGGARESINALSDAQERRFRLARQIDRLEDRGVDVGRLRASLGELTASYARREFGTAKQLSTELSRQVRLSEARLQREQRLQQLISRQARAGGPTEPVRGRVGLTGSPADLAFLARQGGARSPIGGAVGIPGSPAAIRAEERLAAARQRAAQAAEKASQAEGRRIGRLNAVPLRGGAAFPGSPEFLRAALPALPSGYFANQRRQLAAAARRRNDIASNALIGGAFPLLFGQGIGASLGGGLGGAAGGAIGGQFGFGLSLVGTAVGAQLDAGIQRLGALGKALDDPIKQFSTLQQNASLSSKELERYVEGLIAVGRSAEAAATIQQDLIETFGSLQAAQAYNSQIDELNRAWSRATTILASFVVGPLADFLSSLTNTGTRVGTAARFEQLAQTLSPEQYFQVRDRTTAATLQAREARAAAQGGAAGLLTRFLPPSEGDVTAGRREGIKLAEQLLGVEQQRADAAARVAAAQVQTVAAFSDQFRLVDAQTQGYERQALIQEKQAVLNERNRKLLELPENRRTGSPEALQIQQDAALGVYRINQQIAQLDKDRLATSTLQIAEFRLQSTELERQFAAAKRIASIPVVDGVSTVRDTAALRQDLAEQVANARANEARIAAQIQAEQLRGGDGSAERIQELQLAQVNAARETRNAAFDAAARLVDAGRSLRQQIKDATRSIRSTLEGSFELLRPEIRRDLLEAARKRVNFSLFDVGRVRTPSEIFAAANASESIAEQRNIISQNNIALVTSNQQLTKAQIQLAIATNALAKKDWSIYLNGRRINGGSELELLPGAIS